MFCYSPTFALYRIPFAAIQVLYVEFAEHVIYKFGLVTCFMTVQVKGIQPRRCSKTIIFLNEVGILHIRIECLQAS